MVILAGATEGQVYDTLAEAVENAAPESTIRFLEGAELTEWIGVNKELTFDLNGQKVTAAVPFAANQDALFAVNRGGKLTITDGATGGEIDSGAVMCAIKMTQTKAIDYAAEYTDANKAILVVNGGTIKGFNYAIAGNGNPGRGNTEITINGGTLIASDEGVNLLDKCSCAIYNPSENSTLTITGGSITGYDSAVEIRAGSLTVTGGSLTAKNETYAVKGNGNGPTVTGAALAVSQHTTKKELGATVSQVTGATLTGAKAVAVVNPQLNTTDNVEVELGEATYIGGLAYEADGNAVVTDNNSGLAAPAGYDWDNGVLKALVVQIVGGKQYTSLGAAIADLTGTGDETIKLLANYTTTENLAFNKTCTLDLNEKTLTIPGDYRGKPLAALSSSTAYTGVDAGATLTVTNGSVVLAEKNAGGKVNYGFYVVGKLINYANWTHDNTGGPAIELYEGAEVVQNDGVLTSGDIFRSKDDVQAEAIRTITINGGTMTATGNNAYSYPIIYFTKSGTHNIAINGGTFETAVYAYGVAGDTTNISGLDGDCQAKFKNTVITVSGAKTDLSAYVAAGYELVKGDDNYYTIAKIPSFDVTFTKNTTEELGSTNVLRGTALTAEMIPTVEGGEWDVDPVGAVITCNTNFNYTVKAGPDWPSDWPADVPPAMKEAFQTWATTYGVTSFEGVENAFLMNDDPKAGTVTALEITSIEVADGVATIKVAAGEKNLETGINGKLFVSATDDLAGEWATTQVEAPKSYEDEGLTAVFEVEGAQFMKAKVGFKVETPVVKEN